MQIAQSEKKITKGERMLKIHRKISSVVVAALCVVALGAHADERNREHNKSKKDGTIIGAVAGALIGAAAGGGKTDVLVGAAAGGALGRTVGDSIDDRKDRRDGYGRDDYGRDDYGRHGRGDYGRGPRDRDDYGRGRRGPPRRGPRAYYECQEMGRYRFRSFVVVEVYRNRVVEDFGPNYRACMRAADYYNYGR